MGQYRTVDRVNHYPKPTTGGSAAELSPPVEGFSALLAPESAIVAVHDQGLFQGLLASKDHLTADPYKDPPTLACAAAIASCQSSDYEIAMEDTLYL